MGLTLAIKRSYRYFLPPALFEPRRLVRELYLPAFFFIVGLTTGMYQYARETDHERVTRNVTIGLGVLLLFRIWADRPGDRQR